MNTPAYLAAVADQTEIFADWVDGQDPSAPVPTCPAWTLADLVDHVGATQRMVAMLVGERLMDPTTAFERQASVPDSSDDWGAWMTQGLALARDAFSDVDDTTPVWDPSGDAAGVPFWSRRLFGEACIHRADAAAALSLPYDLAPEHAVEALQDWLETMTSAGYWQAKPDFAAAMSGTGQTLHFHASDAEAHWLARRDADRVALDRTAPSDADVVVTGPATDLLLVICRRRSLGDASLDVSGDAALFDHWIANMNWTTD